MAAGSVLLHVLLLALILWFPPEKPVSGSEGPSFEMVMDGSPGTPNEKSNETARPAPGTTTPAPGPEPTPQPPPAPAPAPEPPAPPPPAPPAPTPPAPEPPAPAAPPAPPVPETPPAPPAPVTPPAPQPPAPPDAPPAPTLPPPNAVPRVTLQDPDQTPDLLPPPRTRPPLDMTPLPPLTFAPPPAPRPQAARPQPRTAPRSASGFPTPQNWSLSGGMLSQPSQQGEGGKTSMMAGPAVLGPSVAGPRITGADLGSDWVSLYTQWVRAHLYYPEQAALNGEDGTAEVILQINRSGKVLSVELVTRSGSQWLDLSTTAMFRNARVPPFPANVSGDTATIDQTIHYILRRR